jgi:hypothetical protein
MSTSHKLRVKLGEALPEWQYIHFGFGYRLEPDVFTFFSHDGHPALTEVQRHEWGD